MDVKIPGYHPQMIRVFREAKVDVTVRNFRFFDGSENRQKSSKVAENSSIDFSIEINSNMIVWTSE